MGTQTRPWYFLVTPEFELASYIEKYICTFIAPTLSLSTFVKVNTWEAPCVLGMLVYWRSLPKSISSRMGTLFQSHFIFMLTSTHSGCSINVRRHKIKCEHTVGRGESGLREE